MDDKKVDPQLLQFIQMESQRQKFTEQVHTLSTKCWDVCMPDRPPAKMDSKTQTCLDNCVNRMIDASNFMLQRLQQLQGAGAGGGFS